MWILHNHIPECSNLIGSANIPADGMKTWHMYWTYISFPSPSPFPPRMHTMAKNTNGLREYPCSESNYIKKRVENLSKHNQFCSAVLRLCLFI